MRLVEQVRLATFAYALRCRVPSITRCRSASARFLLVVAISQFTRGDDGE